MNKALTRKWSLTRTGVTTDAFTPKGAAIMVASAALYAIVQVLLAGPALSLQALLSQHIRACKL